MNERLERLAAESYKRAAELEERLMDMDPFDPEFSKIHAEMEKAEGEGDWYSLAASDPAAHGYGE